METTEKAPYKPEPPIHGQNMRLDDGAITNVVSTYPEEVREPVQWLAAFVREKCNRNLNVLEARVKKLGFQTDYSTFHRILTGNYFKEINGRRVGSVHNFRQIIDSLRKEDRIAWRAGKIPFVETTIWHLTSSYIDKKRQPERVCKFGAIVGVTGSQKSACFREYVIRNNHGATKHLEAPETPSMIKFVDSLAMSLGISRHVRSAGKVSEISRSVNERQTIILDNVQRLYKEEKAADQPIFSFLQKLQDDTGCTIILSYTPEFTATLKQGAAAGYFEQFVGRMGGLNKALILPDYPPREDILMIAESFGLVDAHKHIAYLEKITRDQGRIRILFDDLQDAKQEANEDGKPLTIDYVRLVRGEQAQ